MAKYIHGSKYFYGNQVSEYGLQHNRVDYATLAKSFDAVLNNEIIPATAGLVGEWECVNGCEYDDETDEYSEIFQYYIISDAGYQILSDCTDEIVWYNDTLDMYVWGVTHYGTSWNYVLTDIRIDLDKYKEV